MKEILIVGLPFFATKYSYLMNAYLNIGVKPKVLLNMCETKLDEPYDIEFSGKNPFKRMYVFLKLLFMCKPDYIDCYDYSILSIYYVVVAKIFRIKVRFWLIGGELKGDKTHFNKISHMAGVFIKIKLFFTKLSLRIADVIFAKELHHLDSIELINKKLINKVVSIFNCVPISDTYQSRHGVAKDFIYANAVIESRNVLTLIEGLSLLKKRNVKFTASIYGFNSISNEVYDVRAKSYSDRALTMLHQSDLGAEVFAGGFIKEIAKEVITHRFFVFPADTILANYALLESMSVGLVPIIFPGNGYEKIITDGINGIIAYDFNLAPALERALNLSDVEYEKMSLAAYQKIKSDFSISEWSSKLLSTL